MKADASRLFMAAAGLCSSDPACRKVNIIVARNTEGDSPVMNANAHRAGTIMSCPDDLQSAPQKKQHPGKSHADHPDMQS